MTQVPKGIRDRLAKTGTMENQPMISLWRMVLAGRRWNGSKVLKDLKEIREISRTM